MIRFKPDTWIDAVMRPFAMAAPDNNVYVEIAAPDVRLAVVVVLALAALLAWRRLGPSRKPVLTLLALAALSMWPWLETTGNGRYYIPMLLAAGPLCVGLIVLLPLTRSFRIFIGSLVLSLQVFVLAQSSPWGSWDYLRWNDAPYFQVDVPADRDGKPITYVTLSSISYSLIAPQFPSSSRWINLHVKWETPRDEQRVHQILASSNSVSLLAPSLQEQMTTDRQPSVDLKKALDSMLAVHRLALVPDTPCEFLPSQGLAKMQLRSGYQTDDSGKTRTAGFWLCPLRYPVSPPVTEKSVVSARIDAVFERVEHMCPRFFPPKESPTQLISSGAVRHYSSSDMKVYVLDNGNVMYKFWRALNPVLIGRVEDVLSNKATIDCTHIRGRSGLPWDREI